MKSYKDLDKEIILNAPEGAMWYNYKNDMYYTYNGEGVVYFSHNGKWSESSAWFDLSTITSVPESGDMLPLPNTEIPWEATADSDCPVPDGFKVKVSFVDGCNSTDSDPEGWNWTNANHLADSKIVSYKIIDEDYLKPTQEGSIKGDCLEPINVPELEMHRAAYQAIKNAGFESPEELLAQHKCLLDKVANTSEDKLTKSLKFLQNLANEFPEIRNEAIKFMECELDGYMNTLWEKDNDE